MTHADQTSNGTAPARIGDITARYDRDWRIEGIVAEDARFTAQRRGPGGRAAGPVLRAVDVADLARQLEQAGKSARNSARHC